MKKSFTNKTIIDDEEIKLLLWCKENPDLVSMLMSNSDLATKLGSNEELVFLLNSLDEKDLRIFINGLGSEYINKRVVDRGHICYEFKKVEEGNELYQQNHWTIESYYEKLLNDYIRETGLPAAKAKEEFEGNTGSLKKLVNCLKEGFNNNGIDATSSILKMINYTNWDEDSKKRVRELKNILEGVYLPNYKYRYIKSQNEVVELRSVIEEEDKAFLAWTKDNASLVKLLLSNEGIARLVRTIKPSDKELLEWSRENTKLISLLSSNDKLCEILSSIAEDEIPEFVTKLINEYSMNELENSNRIHYEFEPIGDNNPIYRQNPLTIKDYYEKLVQEYMIKTGLSYELASEEFSDLSVSFIDIISALQIFSKVKSNNTTSIKNILDCNAWNENGMKAVAELQSYLNGLCLPNYNKKYIVSPGETDKTNELLKMKNEVLEAQVEYLKEQLASLGQAEKIKEKSL